MRNNDPDRVFTAIGLVKLGESFPKPVNLNPDTRVLALLEVRRLPKHVDSDRVFGNVFRLLQESFLAEIFQQTAKFGRLPERRGMYDAGNLLLHLLHWR